MDQESAVSTPMTPGQESTPQEQSSQQAQPAAAERYSQMYQAPPQVPQIDPAAFKQEILAGVREVVQAATPQQREAPAEPADWLKLLAEGKKDEGVKALAAVLRPMLDIDSLQHNAVQQALSMSAAERQIESYVLGIRSDPANADVLRLEPYITRAANDRVQAAHAAGKIKSPADYVTVTKEAIDAELAAARTLTLAIRGEGKQESAARSREVLSTPNLTPQAIAQRDQAQPPAEQVETPESYLAKRRQHLDRGRGMAIN